MSYSADALSIDFQSIKRRLESLVRIQCQNSADPEHLASYLDLFSLLADRHAFYHDTHQLIERLGTDF